MNKNKTKIVIDSDVIIHFIREDITEITEYCDENDIVYVTTMDFLWRAYKTQIMTCEECDDFISKVKQGGSKLTVDSIIKFTPRDLFL